MRNKRTHAAGLCEGGNRRLDISFATGIASMAVSLPAVFERWAYEIGRSHHGHHGRTDVRRGSSDRSGGIALTMWLCLASGIFVICSNRIKNIQRGPHPLIAAEGRADPPRRPDRRSD